MGNICVRNSVWARYVFTVLLFRYFTRFRKRRIVCAVCGKIVLLIVTLFVSCGNFIRKSQLLSKSKAFETAEDMLEDLTAFLQGTRVYETVPKKSLSGDFAGRTYRRIQDSLELLSGRKQEILESFESLVQDRRLLDAESSFLHCLFTHLYQEL